MQQDANGQVGILACCDCHVPEAFWGATLTSLGVGAGTMRGSFQMVELGKGNEPVRTFDAVVPSVLLRS